MDLKALNKNSLIEKREPAIKLKDLPENEKFKIFGAKIIKSRYGETILLNLGERDVFLPQRVTEDYRKHIEHFSSQKYAIVFKGLVDLGLKQRAASFEVVEN